MAPSAGAGGGGFGSDSPPSATAGAPTIGSGVAGASSIAPPSADIGNGSGVTCGLAPTDDPVFAGQIIHPETAGRGELYSWISAEEAVALRAGQMVFPPQQSASYVVNAFDGLSMSSDPSTAQLATALGAQLDHARLAWPEPWALRVGPEGEDSGHVLLRILLKPESLVAVVKGGKLQILDLDNQSVPLESALPTPERIGAIFNQRDAFEGGPGCGLKFDGTGQLAFRQFIVGNQGMVAEWSLGTQQIRDRLQTNVDQLSKLLVKVRPCPDQSSQQLWNAQVACSWDAPLVFPIGEQVAYHQALASPTADYLGAPAQLGAMIEKLREDLFTVDPFVVTLGSP